MQDLLENFKKEMKNLPLEKDEYSALYHATEAVITDSLLLEKAQSYYSSLFENEIMLGREIAAWEDLYAEKKLGAGMIFTVVMFARAYYLTEKQYYSFCGNPLNFFNPLLRHFRINQKKYSSFGLMDIRKYWTYCYLKPTSFELGRLAYEIIDYNYGYEVYKNEITGETFPVALDGLRFNSDGLPDEAGDFVTTLKKENDTIIGYTYTKDGHINFKEKAFENCRCVLKASDKVLAVHMPGNEKLTEESVSDSLEGAKVFFDTYFPTLNYKAFVSSTWLLDTGLRKILNENSNIIKLQNRFRITLALKNDFSLFDNIFNVPRCSVEELVPQNRFQAEILEMIKSGRGLYSGRGYILRDCVPEKGD